MFTDRHDAGRQLAAVLSGRGWADPVVLALPRGGVPVGVEIAAQLHAPLDVLMVRKLGAPDRPELAMGAVAKTGESVEVVLNEDIVGLLCVDDEAIDAAKRRELALIKEREARYHAGRRRPRVQDRTAIVVDDGIATGATMRAALRAVRRAQPAAIILAVPVAPADTIARLAGETDDIFCLTQPDDFGAIGLFYDDFSQVGDADVVAALARFPEAAGVSGP